MSDTVIEWLIKLRPVLRFCLYACIIALVWQAGNLSTKWRESNLTLGNVPAQEFVDFTINLCAAVYLLKRLGDEDRDFDKVKLVKQALREHEQDKA